MTLETLNSWKEAATSGEDMHQFLKKVHATSRDNARSPMQWSSGKNAGFSEGKPWLKVNTNHQEINVEKQEIDSDSILNFYRSMISFRKQNPLFVYGDYQCLDLENKELFAYRRWNDNEEYLVLLNFSDVRIFWRSHFEESNFELIKSNMELSESNFSLMPWQSKILRYKK